MHTPPSPRHVTDRSHQEPARPAEGGTAAPPTPQAGAEGRAGPQLPQRACSVRDLRGQRGHCCQVSKSPASGRKMESDGPSVTTCRWSGPSVCARGDQERYQRQQKVLVRLPGGMTHSGTSLKWGSRRHAPGDRETLARGRVFGRTRIFGSGG